MASKTNTGIAREARSRAEVDFATWLMMAKLGSFDDLPANAQAFLTSYRGKLDQMSESESKIRTIREVYDAYYREMGGAGATPSTDPLDTSTDDNIVRFQKPRRPQPPSSAAGTTTGPKGRRPVPALLIFAGMVAVIAAYKLLAN